MNTALKRLEIRHFRLVQALFLTDGMSAAAKYLHLTQSALSHQLKVLEDTLGCELFLRHGKKLIITAAGRRVLQTANDVLMSLNEMTEDLDRIDQGDNVTLRIATECYTAFHWLPKVILPFKKHYPNIHVELLPHPTNQVTKLLKSGEIDLAIKMFPAKPLFQNHSIFSDQLVVVMAEHHPLTNKKEIFPEDIRNENLLLCPNAKDKLFMGLSQHIDTHNIKITEFPMTEAIVEWCHAGMGISIIANWAAKAWQREGISIKPFNVSWGSRFWTAVTLPQELPVYLKDFNRFLKENAPI